MKLIVSMLVAFFIVGCSQEKKNEAQEAEAVTTQKVKVAEEKSALDKAKEELDDKVSEAKEELSVAKEEIKNKVSEAKESLDTKLESVKETTAEVVEEVKEKVASVTEEEIDGSALYNRCANCHGGMGEISALGKSAVIRNWSMKQIESALLGYKAGTYGRTMKGMMQQQVKNLSDAEIHALAKYISE